MASVVFLRAVNVGGHQKFQPSVLARTLAEFGVVNVGAAGTFVVRQEVSRASLRAEILRHLPFEPELMICGASEILALAAENPFRQIPAGKEIRPFVSVLQKAPGTLPRLPLDHPAGSQWQVKLVGIRGRFVLSLWRRLGRAILYPNAVVEKQLSVPATTRNWNTISTICRILAG